METAVYIHIPFCRSKCVYCDFLSFANPTDADTAHYLQALEKELEIRGQELQSNGIAVTSLYIGGGTPTVLSADALAKLFSMCRGYLPLLSPEWTMEANPGTLTKENIKILTAAGVNRISLGVQDLCDKRLALLGRLHNAVQAKQAFMACLDSFASVSVDVMAALPGQTTAAFMDTLETICSWAPHHISVYGLKVEADTPLQEMVDFGQVHLPGEETAVEIFVESRKLLVGCGYEHYEIANFAKAGHRSRHNQVYWHNLPYLGLGLGAHSFWQKERLMNTHALLFYQEQLKKGVLPVSERHRVSLRQEMEDTMMLGLRLLEGVRFDTFRERYGKDLREVFASQIEHLMHLGVIDCDDRVIRLSKAGLPLANEVFAEFISEEI